MNPFCHGGRSSSDGEGSTRKWRWVSAVALAKVQTPQAMKRAALGKDWEGFVENDDETDGASSRKTARSLPTLDSDEVPVLSLEKHGLVNLLDGIGYLWQF